MFPGPSRNPYPNTMQRFCICHFSQPSAHCTVCCTVLKLDPKIQNKGFMQCSLIHTEKVLDDQSEGIFVGFMCTYPRDETWVHQQASLHQLHYPHSDSRHDITFISLKSLGGALFVCNAIFPHVYYHYIGIREKNSNLDSSVEKKVMS